MMIFFDENISKNSPQLIEMAYSIFIIFKPLGKITDLKFKDKEFQYGLGFP